MLIETLAVQREPLFCYNYKRRPYHIYNSLIFSWIQRPYLLCVTGDKVTKPKSKVTKLHIIFILIIIYIIIYIIIKGFMSYINLPFNFF